jgi:hypothetical protein
MEPIELRDQETARRFVLEGLWLQQAIKPIPSRIQEILEWAMEVAAAGHPLPPIGFVADVGHVAFDSDAEHRLKETFHIPGWPLNLARTYEDHILGRLYVDWMFERASDALRRYNGRDRIKGLAYIVNQIRERSDCCGVLLPPAVIRGLLATSPEDVLTQGWDSLARDGPLDFHIRLYEELVASGRRLSEVLVREDVDALEDRSALGDMGQYVALRQIRQTTARFESLLPTRPVRPHIGRKEVPTRALDEDQYPVGGYTSISTRGSLESLLHSQLAFMEPQSPDLFDIKFVRDELFYYSRDENQFLRRRRAFVFVLFPSLVEARFKDRDSGLPYQRIVVLQSAILALIHRLSDWLSTDAIRFEVLFIQDGAHKPLMAEATEMELLLREPINRGEAMIGWLPDKSALVARLDQLSCQFQVHCLAVGSEPFDLDLENVVVNELVVSSARPEIGTGDGIVASLEGEDAFDVWLETLLRILQLWV